MTFHSCELVVTEWISEQTYNSKTWRSVVLPSDLKDRLVRDIDVFMNSEKWYKEIGVAWKRGLLLSGKPGTGVPADSCDCRKQHYCCSDYLVTTGKTSIIKAISHVQKMHIYAIKLNHIQTDDELHSLFRSIPP